MNILIINHEFPPVGGGGGVFSKMLGEGLSGLNNNVFILTAGNEVNTEEISKNCKVIYLKNGRKSLICGDFFSLLKFIAISIPHIKTICSKYKIDIINSHFFHTSGLAVFFSRLNIPHIVSALGADVYDPTRYNKIRFLMNCALKKIGSKSDAVIVSSSDMRSRLLNISQSLNEKTRIIPHCIKSDCFSGEKNNNLKIKMGIDSNVKIILSVCRLIPRKNLEFALNVIKKIVEKKYLIKYFIVGGGPEKKNLEEIAEKLKLSTFVHFFDYTNDSELKEIYENSDIFLMPSKHEAFGISALEAMASRIPPVCSNIGGWSDFIINAQTGYLCGDADEYVKRIAGLIDDSGLYAYISENCRRKAVNEFDYKIISKKYFDLMKEIKENSNL
ncbi:MAG TPA: glycosyltransferase family 4 protein [bacterium]|nr:glycosyltransferase family 4 protein [bacterium]